jgi:hypothetical protein
MSLLSQSIVCSNPDCGKLTVSASVVEDIRTSNGYRLAENPTVLFGRRIVPESSAKPQPEFIPQALRNDYVEACMIRDFSPKASATLARRCLQGMIRNFTGISKGRLIDEIKELKELASEDKAPKGVSPETVEAIDHVRNLGNIGAHMEKDINIIVDVDSDEAQVLIELIEMLFEEWYVAQKRREERIAKVIEISLSKKKKISEMKKPRLEAPKDDAAE